MARSVFIDGGAGTTGLEIADRLAGRSEFELVADFEPGGPGRAVDENRVRHQPAGSSRSRWT